MKIRERERSNIIIILTYLFGHIDLKLIDVTDFIRGVSYSKNDEINMNEDLDYTYILRANNISINNQLVYEDVKKIKNNIKIKDNQRLFKDDILMCISSGSKEHVGKVAYVLNDIDNYSFGAFMAKVKTLKCANPRFIYHFLSSDKFNNQLDKLISNTTINNINNHIYSNINLTIPSLSIQKKIVDVLDNFEQVCSSLNIGLPKEIELRNKQYEFYRNQIFNYLTTGEFERERDLIRLLVYIFGNVNVTLEDIGYFYNGLTGKTKSDFNQDSNSYYVSYVDIFNNLVINNNLNLNNKVNISENEKQNKVKIHDLLFTNSSENFDECAMCCLYTKDINNDVYLNSFSFGYRIYDHDLVNPHFLKHLFHTNVLRNKLINVLVV
ncbi:restriction endonuclease subunit S [Mycoplasma tullyi]|uniref:Restriction endonuclease subunit S n=1 Tax=Mycoplasma tullyi TaxID=1612150 RepID=A0A7D7U4Y0_9MOLU|nr:restriction endonuclease subunit S [Mycoplasma tullyi]QMT98809.1 restriction endonuclease subunit S [Mycoplasma tullyi]